MLEWKYQTVSKDIHDGYFSVVSNTPNLHYSLLALGYCSEVLVAQQRNDKPRPGKTNTCNGTSSGLRCACHFRTCWWKWNNWSILYKEKKLDRISSSGASVDRPAARLTRWRHWHAHHERDDSSRWLTRDTPPFTAFPFMQCSFCSDRLSKCFSLSLHKSQHATMAKVNSKIIHLLFSLSATSKM